MELNWNIYCTQGHSEAELAERFVDAISKQYNLQFYANKTAIYFVSPNSGTFSSIEFWKNALEHSPRFANPGIFPWTLANATSGYIARKFSITGPNYTIVEPDIDTSQLMLNFKKDQDKFELKNALLIYWKLRTIKSQLSADVNWTILV